MSDALYLPETGYGSGTHAVILIEGSSLVDIAHKVRYRRHRRSGDNPGQIFAWDCEIIKLHRGDYGGIVAICIASTYRDI